MLGLGWRRMTSLSRPSDDRAYRPDAILLVNLASGRSTLATATSLANGAYLGRQEVPGVVCCGADRPSRTRLDLISRTSPSGRAGPQTSMDGLRRSCAAGVCRPRGCVRVQAGQSPQLPPRSRHRRHGFVAKIRPRKLPTVSRECRREVSSWQASPCPQK